ncbi:type III-B CRISPR module RAMP protein Cmr1 [Pelagibius sp. Alg239-R121]|uniref:type III-B CRISPR module RAMP protein Cmr1 n=1 Tax=Pelagibius sp. Alg239-R121 TaxID=2993448 RepID=UPI0024A63A75|nr:type III-B CRISPR module RAMP protein Cmr1 [Pelagibius sp. Alg239-R121]
MDCVEAEFRIVTPMFLGGADNSTSAELRAPSIKGVLRFWWRAMMYQHFPDLKELRKKEAELFGAAGSKDGGGQSSFHLSVVSQPRCVIKRGKALSDEEEPSQENIGPGAHYFGYGVFEQENKKTCKGKLSRPCLRPGRSFIIRIIARRKIDPSIVAAVELMGLLGGLGSRTRRGYGSIALQRLTRNGELIWNAPENCQDYAARIRALVPEINTRELPPYTAFGRDSRVAVLARGQSALGVLNEIGEAMIRYRSAGKFGKLWPLKKGEHTPWSEENFQDDHDWFHNVYLNAPTEGPRSPKRVVFGLPHNYFSSIGQGLTKRVTVEGPVTKSMDRRASPLMIHIHPLGDRRYVGVVSILGSQFLPARNMSAMVSSKMEGCFTVCGTLDGTFDGAQKNITGKFQGEVQDKIRKTISGEFSGRFADKPKLGSNGRILGDIHGQLVGRSLKITGQFTGHLMDPKTGRLNGEISGDLTPGPLSNNVALMPDWSVLHDFMDALKVEGKTSKSYFDPKDVLAIIGRKPGPKIADPTFEAQRKEPQL